MKGMKVGRKILWTLALALLTAALAAGCGGGGSSGSSSSSGAAAEGGTTTEEGAATEGAGAGNGSAAPEEGGQGGNGAGEEGGQGSGNGQSNGGGSGTGGGESPAKTAFAAEAEAACQAVKKETGKTLEAILKKSGGLNGLTKESVVKEITEKAVIPDFEQKVSALRGLKPPPEMEEALGAVIDSLEKVLAEAQANPGKFNFEGKAVIESEQLAEKEGLAACGGI